MKFTQSIALAILSLTAQVHGSWVVAVYAGGNSCGSTSTNYAVYDGSDSGCQQIGAGGHDCTGFIDGGSQEDSGVCNSPFTPTSFDINESDGLCTFYPNSNCAASGDAQQGFTGTGCFGNLAAYGSFNCD